jgi:dihydrofolate synthase/folylpolyglutamate synthase
MMTFREAGEYLLGTINETASRRNPQRLERMSALLRNLGDPHLQYPTIHVGGTSGKGSTCTMIAAALTASGRVTGLHTKPHLSSMTERARIDGRAVEEEEFARLLDEMMPALQATAQEYGRPSYYETLLALAYVHFREAKVDVAVIEVGVGGSLDGTNLLRPETSVITNVGLDHTEILGDTVELIARDKAGIAKAGVPLVSDAVSPAREVIEAACGRAGAPFIAVSEHAQVVARSGDRDRRARDAARGLAAHARAGGSGLRQSRDSRTHGVLSGASGGGLRRRAQSRQGA